MSGNLSSFERLSVPRAESVKLRPRTLWSVALAGVLAISGLGVFIGPTIRAQDNDDKRTVTHEDEFGKWEATGDSRGRAQEEIVLFCAFIHSCD